MRGLGGAALAVACAAVLAGCGGHGGDGAQVPASSVPASISVTSEAFDQGGSIPERFTCDGAGDVPPIAWTKPPEGTDAFAVLVDDPDAPSGTFTHWILLDLPRQARSLADRAAGGVHEAKNSAGSTGWTPPCPPSGDPAHHYRFTVYALSSGTGLEDGASVADARAAINKLAVARGRLVGRYARGG